MTEDDYQLTISAEQQQAFERALAALNQNLEQIHAAVSRSMEEMLPLFCEMGTTLASGLVPALQSLAKAEYDPSGAWLRYYETSVATPYDAEANLAAYEAFRAAMLGSDGIAAGADGLHLDGDADG